MHFNNNNKKYIDERKKVLSRVKIVHCACRVAVFCTCDSCTREIQYIARFRDKLVILLQCGHIFFTQGSVAFESQLDVL